MKRILRFLLSYIPSDPHLWIALLVGCFFVVMELLKVFHQLNEGEGLHGLSLDVGVTVIVICIISMVADHLKESGQVRDNAEKITRTVQTVVDVDQSLRGDRKVALRASPDSPEEYDYLWGGYTGTYRAYNPRYLVDKNLDEEKEDREKIVKLFIRRYQNPEFVKAQYLFLTGDDSGKEALEYFRDLMQQVKKQCKDVVGKVQVKEMKEKAASSEAEMYLGRRHHQPMGVVELREPILNPEGGRPHYYLVIYDEEVFEHYRQWHFDQAWDDKKNAQDVQHFWR
jgi:hypothetical protein